MLKKLILTLALALPVFANTSLFTKYEAVRQGILSSSLPAVQKAATQLEAEARTAKKPELAKQAGAVAKSADLMKARAAFAEVSAQMIPIRAAAKGSRPAVYYCPMVRKSWLQPKGKIGNPYDKAMESCGELKEE